MIKYVTVVIGLIAVIYIVSMLLTTLAAVIIPVTLCIMTILMLLGVLYLYNTTKK
jgi:hypothetical protein